MLQWIESELFTTNSHSLQTVCSLVAVTSCFYAGIEHDIVHALVTSGLDFVFDQSGTISGRIQKRQCPAAEKLNPISLPLTCFKDKTTEMGLMKHDSNHELINYHLCAEQNLRLLYANVFIKPFVKNRYQTIIFSIFNYVHYCCMYMWETFT